MRSSFGNVQAALTQVHEREGRVAIIIANLTLHRLEIVSELRYDDTVREHARKQGNR